MTYYFVMHLSGDDNDTQRKLPIPNEPPPPLPAGAGSGGPSLDAVQFPSGDVRYVSEWEIDFGE